MIAARHLARAEGLEPPTVENPVLETGALPLSYARVAGEIGIEPMSSALCLHAVLSRTCVRNTKKKARDWGPADRVERIQSVSSGAPRMRTTSEPASHRCVLGLYQGRWRCGSIVATLTRPASLHYSVVVQVLGGG